MVIYQLNSCNCINMRFLIYNVVWKKYITTLSSDIINFFLTMLAEMLDHPPHHQGHTILHQARLLKLKQGRSKQLGLLCCHHPGSQYGYLDHLLHVFFDLHCCLVVLHGEEQRGAVSHGHYGHRELGCRRHQVGLDSAETQVLEDREAHSAPKT